MLSGSAAAPLGPIQPATLHWAQPCVHRSARSLNEMLVGPFEESGFPAEALVPVVAQPTCMR